jgi:hypothetical protein
LGKGKADYFISLTMKPELRVKFTRRTLTEEPISKLALLPNTPTTPLMADVPNCIGPCNIGGASHNQEQNLGAT